jgi:predicted RNA-binding Zn ribbon-like protein
MSTLAFALAATIKHDGHGGVADLLATPAETITWLNQHEPLIETVLGQPLPGLHQPVVPTPVDTQPNVGRDTDWEERVQGELQRIRRAVRGLFARAVAPGAPSKADADRLMDAGAALQMINRAADRLGAQKLVWQEDGKPSVQWAWRTSDPVALLVGAVGRSTIDFLTGPDRERLRACPAARCVKYFLQDDPRQMWCSASCGNRERVNRYYRKRHG